MRLLCRSSLFRYHGGDKNVVRLPRDVRPQKGLTAQQQRFACVPHQKSVVVPAAPAQPPSIGRCAGAGNDSEVDIRRCNEGRFRRRLQNAVRTGAQNGQVRYLPALHDTGGSTQRHAQALAVRQHPPKQRQRVDLITAPHKGEHRPGAVIHCRVHHMMQDGCVGGVFSAGVSARSAFASSRRSMSFCRCIVSKLLPPGVFYRA